MSGHDLGAFPALASEAIVLLDLVESTATSNLFGWYAVGRGLMREMRGLVAEAGRDRGLLCVKSTGDGYLLAFGDPQSAETAAVQAVECVFALLATIAERNTRVPEERAIHLRFAVHFGEVDVVENDREGPHVSYTFRIESISRESFVTALIPMPAEQLPLRDYVLCSEEVAGILARRSEHWKTRLMGHFKLKGFSGWREVFLVEPGESYPPQ